MVFDSVKWRWKWNRKYYFVPFLILVFATPIKAGSIKGETTVSEPAVGSDEVATNELTSLATDATTAIGISTSMTATRLKDATTMNADATSQAGSAIVKNETPSFTDDESISTTTNQTTTVKPKTTVEQTASSRIQQQTSSDATNTLTELLTEKLSTTNVTTSIDSTERATGTTVANAEATTVSDATEQQEAATSLGTANAFAIEHTTNGSHTEPATTAGVTNATTDVTDAKRSDETTTINAPFEEPDTTISIETTTKADTGKTVPIYENEGSTSFGGLNTAAYQKSTTVGVTTEENELVTSDEAATINGTDNMVTTPETERSKTAGAPNTTSEETTTAVSTEETTIRTVTEEQGTMSPVETATTKDTDKTTVTSPKTESPITAEVPMPTTAEVTGTVTSDEIATTADTEEKVTTSKTESPTTAVAPKTTSEETTIRTVTEEQGTVTAVETATTKDTDKTVTSPRTERPITAEVPNPTTAEENGIVTAGTDKKATTSKTERATTAGAPKTTTEETTTTASTEETTIRTVTEEQGTMTPVETATTEDTGKMVTGPKTERPITAEVPNPTTAEENRIVTSDEIATTAGTDKKVTTSKTESATAAGAPKTTSEETTTTASTEETTISTVNEEQGTVTPVETATTTGTDETATDSETKRPFTTGVPNPGTEKMTTVAATNIDVTEEQKTMTSVITTTKIDSGEAVSSSKTDHSTTDRALHTSSGKRTTQISTETTTIAAVTEEQETMTSIGTVTKVNTDETVPTSMSDHATTLVGVPNTTNGKVTTKVSAESTTIDTVTENQGNMTSVELATEVSTGKTGTGSKTERPVTVGVSNQTTNKVTTRSPTDSTSTSAVTVEQESRTVLVTTGETTAISKTESLTPPDAPTTTTDKLSTEAETIIAATDEQEITVSVEKSTKADPDKLVTTSETEHPTTSEMSTEAASNSQDTTALEGEATAAYTNKLVTGSKTERPTTFRVTRTPSDEKMTTSTGKTFSSEEKMTTLSITSIVPDEVSLGEITEVQTVASATTSVKPRQETCDSVVDDSSNTTFPTTNVGNFAFSEEHCGGQDGRPLARRYCSRGEVWGIVIEQNCSVSSSELLATISIENMTVEEATTTLLVVSVAENLTVEQTDATIDKLSQLTAENNSTYSASVTDSFVSVVENIFEKVIASSQPTVNKTEKLNEMRDTTEKILLKQNTNESYSVKKSTFSAKVLPIPKIISGSVAFGKSNDDKDLLPDGSPDIEIELPAALLQSKEIGSSSKIAIVVYDNDDFFSSNDGKAPASVVISISIGDENGKSTVDGLETNPITIDFDLSAGGHSISNPVCVYFDYGDGAWSTSGGNTTYVAGKVFCQWSHLTEFSIVNSSEITTTETLSTMNNYSSVQVVTSATQIPTTVGSEETTTKGLQTNSTAQGSMTTTSPTKQEPTASGTESKTSLMETATGTHGINATVLATAITTAETNITVEGETTKETIANVTVAHTSPVVINSTAAASGPETTTLVPEESSTSNKSTTLASQVNSTSWVTATAHTGMNSTKLGPTTTSLVTTSTWQAGGTEVTPTVVEEITADGNATTQGASEEITVGTEMNVTIKEVATNATTTINSISTASAPEATTLRPERNSTSIESTNFESKENSTVQGPATVQPGTNSTTLRATTTPVKTNSTEMAGTTSGTEINPSAVTNRTDVNITEGTQKTITGAVTNATVGEEVTSSPVASTIISTTSSTTVCHQAVEANMTFLDTDVGSFAFSEEKCTDGGRPKATRYCAINGTWGTAEKFNCSDSNVVLLSSIESAESGASILLVISESENITNDDIAGTVDKLHELISENNDSLPVEVTNSLVTTADNLMSDVAQMESSSMKKQELEVLRNSTYNILMKQSTSSLESYSFKRELFSAKVVTVPLNKSEGFSFGQSKDEKDLLPPASPNLSIHLTSEVLESIGVDENSKIAIVVFEDDSTLPSSTSSTAGNVIVSITIGDELGSLNINGLNSGAIQLDFEFEENNDVAGNSICAFYDYTEQDWSTVGGNTSVSGGKVTCRWNHLTEFTILHSPSTTVAETASQPVTTTATNQPIMLTTGSAASSVSQSVTGISEQQSTTTQQNISEETTATHEESTNVEIGATVTQSVTTVSEAESATTGSVTVITDAETTAIHEASTVPTAGSTVTQSATTGSLAGSTHTREIYTVSVSPVTVVETTGTSDQSALLGDGTTVEGDISTISLPTTARWTTSSEAESTTTRQETIGPVTIITEAETAISDTTVLATVIQSVTTNSGSDSTIADGTAQSVNNTGAEATFTQSVTTGPETDSTPAGEKTTGTAMNITVAEASVTQSVTSVTQSATTGSVSGSTASQQETTKSGWDVSETETNANLEQSSARAHSTTVPQSLTSGSQTGSTTTRQETSGTITVTTEAETDTNESTVQVTVTQTVATDAGSGHIITDETARSVNTAGAVTMVTQSMTTGPMTDSTTARGKSTEAAMNITDTEIPVTQSVATGSDQTTAQEITQAVTSSIAVDTTSTQEKSTVAESSLSVNVTQTATAGSALGSTATQQETTRSGGDVSETETIANQEQSSVQGLSTAVTQSTTNGSDIDSTITRKETSGSETATTEAEITTNNSTVLTTMTQSVTGAVTMVTQSMTTGPVTNSTTAGGETTDTAMSITETEIPVTQSVTTASKVDHTTIQEESTEAVTSSIAVDTTSTQKESTVVESSVTVTQTATTGSPPGSTTTHQETTGSGGDVSETVTSSDQEQSSVQEYNTTVTQSVTTGSEAESTTGKQDTSEQVTVITESATSTTQNESTVATTIRPVATGSELSSTTTREITGSYSGTETETTVTQLATSSSETDPATTRHDTTEAIIVTTLSGTSSALSTIKQEGTTFAESVMTTRPDEGTTTPHVTNEVATEEATTVTQILTTSKKTDFTSTQEETTDSLTIITETETTTTTVEESTVKEDSTIPSQSVASVSAGESVTTRQETPVITTDNETDTTSEQSETTASKADTTAVPDASTGSVIVTTEEGSTSTQEESTASKGSTAAVKPLTTGSELEPTTARLGSTVSVVVSSSPGSTTTTETSTGSGMRSTHSAATENGTEASTFLTSSENPVSSTNEVTATSVHHTVTVQVMCDEDEIEIVTENASQSITFSSAKPGEYIYSREKCPSDNRARAVRYCSRTGAWDNVVTLVCNQTNQQILSSINVTSATVPNALLAINVLTRSQGLKENETSSIVDFIRQIANTQAQTSVATMDLFIDTVDNAIGNQDDVTNTTKRNGNLRSLGESITKEVLKLDMTNGDYTLSNNRFEVSISRIPTNTTNGLTYSATNSEGRPYPRVHVPEKALLAQGPGPDSKIAFVLFTDSTLFPSDDQPVGPIISLVIGDSKGSADITNLTDSRIQIGIDVADYSSDTRSRYNQPLRPLDLNATCVFYDYNSRRWAKDGGSFSSDNESVAQCLWSHATSFSLLAQPFFKYYRPEVIVMIGCGIAVGILAAVTAVYLCFWRLRSDPIDVVTLNISLTLFMAFLTYLCSSAMWGTLPRANCLVLSTIHHFFLLSAFIWMATMSYLADRCCLAPKEWILWIALSDEKLTYKMIWKLCLVTYGVSFVIWAVTAGITIGLVEENTSVVGETTFVSSNAYTEANFCAVKDWALLGGLAAPAGLCVLMSIIVYIRILCKKYSNNAILENNFRGYYTQYRMALQLHERAFIIPLLMAILWTIQFIRLSVDDLLEDISKYFDIAFGVLAIVFSIVLGLLLLLRPTHVRNILRKVAIRTCCVSQGSYYFDHESHRPNFRSIPGPASEDVPTVHLPFGTTVTSSASQPRSSVTRIGIREDIPGTGVRVKRWRASDAVAQTDFDLTGGKLGLKGFKQTAYDSVQLRTFSQESSDDATIEETTASGLGSAPELEPSETDGKQQSQGNLDSVDEPEYATVSRIREKKKSDRKKRETVRTKNSQSSGAQGGPKTGSVSAEEEIENKESGVGMRIIQHTSNNETTPGPDREEINYEANTRSSQSSESNGEGASAILDDLLDSHDYEDGVPAKTYLD